MPSVELPRDIRSVIASATRHSKSARCPSAEVFAAEVGAAFVRRIQEDPRTVLRKWLNGLRAPDARVVEEPTDSPIFDAQLVDEGSMIRRFASVVRSIQDPSGYDGTDPSDLMLAHRPLMP